MSEGSRSRSGSVSSYSSFASTESAKEVAMNKVQRTSEKKMRVTGVNGCTSIHLFGANFIVGAHAEPSRIPIVVRQAADSAGAGVTSIVVWAPGADDGNLAVTQLQGHYPQARIALKYYVVDSSPGTWWQFEGSQGGTVSAKHVLG